MVFSVFARTRDASNRNTARVQSFALMVGESQSLPSIHHDFGLRLLPGAWCLPTNFHAVECIELELSRTDLI